MVEFLNKDKAFAEIVEIVSKAESKLVLISPYIKIPEDLLERLKYIGGKGIRIIVVCRDKDLKADVRSELKRLRNLELRFDEDLHAKCFYNEKSMVITSLNLHEHSKQYNREMGVLLNSEEDSNVFKEALNEAEFIVSRAKKDSTISRFVKETAKEAKSVLNLSAKDSARKTSIPSRTKNQGHCIRCGKSITYDLDAPYCPDCYRVWNKYKDPDYEEKHCHWCNKPATTTIEYPLCRSCYNKSRRG